MSALAAAEVWQSNHFETSRKPLVHLCPQELLSIYAVLAYIAHHQDVRQELVQTLVEAEFSVDNIAKIPQSDYNSVMTFLIDLRMDQVRSAR